MIRISPMCVDGPRPNCFLVRLAGMAALCAAGVAAAFDGAAPGPVTPLSSAIGPGCGATAGVTSPTSPGQDVTPNPSQPNGLMPTGVFPSSPPEDKCSATPTIWASVIYADSPQPPLVDRSYLYTNDGTIILEENDDDEPPEPDPIVFCGTSFGHQQYSCGGTDTAIIQSLPRVSNGYMGKNRFYNGRPEIVRVQGGGNPERLFVLFSANRFSAFEKLADPSTTYVGINGELGAIVHEDGPSCSSTTPGTYTYYDIRGHVWTFFDFAINCSDSTKYRAYGAAGQLWKVSTADGGSAATTLYTGHATNIATALSDGFIQSGGHPTSRPAVAFDAAGRRISYQYDSSDHLQYVWTEINPGSTWGSPGDTALTLVKKVEYRYYPLTEDSSTTNHGSTGDLAYEVQTTPLTSGGDLTKTKYYRYYTADYNASSTPPNLGHPNYVKLVLHAEGTRAFNQDHSGSMYADLAAASDDDLKPYASAYYEYTNFTYNTATPPVKIKAPNISGYFEHGNCPCAGGGLVQLTWEDNPLFADSSYSAKDNWDHTAWKTRVTAKRPDSTGGSTPKYSYTVIYFDKMREVIATVISDDDPTLTGTSKPHFWITKYDRDDRGHVTRIYTPEAVDSTNYYHVDGTSPNFAGTIPVRSDGGFVKHYDYYKSTPNYLPNAIVRESHSKGWSNGSSPPSKIVDVERLFNSPTDGSDWVYRVAGDAWLARPLPYKVWRFRNEVSSGGSTIPSGSSSDRDETDYAYTFYTVSSADTWMVKSVTQTNPTVDTSHHGSGSSTSITRYFDEFGKVVFSKTADGRISYFERNALGLLTRQIQDVDTNSGDSSLTAASTKFGMTLPANGSTIRSQISFTYDVLGRIMSVNSPSVNGGISGRISVMHYTKLGDGQYLTLSVPMLSGSTYTGPADYRVYNLNKRLSFQGTIALPDTGGTTSTAITSWINSGQSEPKAALSVGTIERASTYLYNSSGDRTTTARTYFAIPSSFPGSPPSDYCDESGYTYDCMGRQASSTDPTGTISRWRYDALGRVNEKWIGTTDATFPCGPGSPSGTHNMTCVEKYEYDNNNVGNSNLTKKTQDADGNWTTTTDQRVTSYLYDYRGRWKVAKDAAAPHWVVAYDNRGRRTAVASYSSDTGLTVDTDPTASIASTRLTLSETLYDERGQVYMTKRHKVVSGGTFTGTDALIDRFWYDADGRQIKTRGATLQKYAYDALDRRMVTYTLAQVDEGDTGTGDYAAAATVSGDIVLEESQTLYDAKSGRVLATVNLSRHHDKGTGVTGALDSNSGALVVATSAARPQIMSYWYDDLDRVITTVNYGTYTLNESGGHSSFDRSGLSAPTRTDTSVIITSTTFDKDGSILETESPCQAATPTTSSGTKTRYLYDRAGRQVAVISNYTGATITTATRTNDTYVRYKYTHGLMTAMWVDQMGNDTTGVPPTSLTGSDAGDQVTTYTYGTSTGTGDMDSQLVTGHLLKEVLYPAGAYSSTADRTVTYSYNALGENLKTQNQLGIRIKTTYDLLGRETKREVDNPSDLSGAGLDTSVQRIDLAYTSKGQLYTVVQQSAPSGGSEVNGIRYTYDDWGNVTKIEEDPDSAVGSGGTVYEVQYAYTDDSTARPTNGRYSIRRSTSTYPGSYVVTNVYASDTSAPFDNVVGRVTSVTLTYPDGAGGTWTTSDRIRYRYLGLAQLIGTEYPEPNATHNFYTVPSSDVVYATRLDTFNRVIGDVWTHAGTGTAHDLTLSYDRNGNIISTLDNRHQANGTLTYSNKYDMDDLNRVTKADRGVLSGGSISGSIRHTELWSLSQTGNWLSDKVDLNGGTNYTDSGEYNDTRTYNDLNQISTRDTDSTSGTTGNNYSLTYDKAGQLTDDGKSYKYLYDAFGRLVKLTDRGSTPSTKAEYRYNGLGQRVAYKLNGTGTWYDLVQDEQWREVGVVDRTNNKLLERTLYHNAGLNGRGGSSYIDSAAIRETNPTSPGSGITPLMQTHWYTLQNWRADVVATLTSNGSLTAWSSYTAYGKQQIWGVADVDDGSGNGVPDGGVTIDDFLLYDAWFEAGDPRADLDDGSGKGIPDGGVTIDDFLFYLDWYGGSGGDFNSRIGYAGYVKDEADSAQSGLYHVRCRGYIPELGKWLSRDPFGYVDSMSLYEYVSARPVCTTDPFGLYQPAGHYYTTFIQARCAGLSIDRALSLAYYSQYPDQVSNLDATSLGVEHRMEQLLGLDYPGSDSKSRDIYNYVHSLHGGAPEPRQDCLAKLLSDDSMRDDYRGIIIHAFGDSYAHTFEKKGKLYSYSWPNGHLRHGEKPDIIANHPDKYKRYTGRLCSVLSGGKHKNAISIIGIPSDEKGAEDFLKQKAIENGFPANAWTPGEMTTDPTRPGVTSSDVNKIISLIKAACDAPTADGPSNMSCEK